MQFNRKDHQQGQMSAAIESPTEPRQVTYGSERIDFLLGRRLRKTLAINLSVNSFLPEAAISSRSFARFMLT